MKSVQLPDGSEVRLRKSKRARRLTIKVTAEGTIEATIPYYLPYIVAESFVREHHGWIQKNKPPEKKLLTSGKLIGRQHQLIFALGKPSLSSRVNATHVTVNVPKGYTSDDATVQEEAKKAAIRALKRQAETYLPSKIYELARKHTYTYRQVQVKKMRSRWGSCSSAKSINLSIWLMQLPDDLIEYVLCHELTHLNHMNHSAQFWAELAVMIPDYKKRRATLKNFSPHLM